MYKLPQIEHAVFKLGKLVARRVPRYDRFYGNYISLNGKTYAVTYMSGYTVHLGEEINLNKKPFIYKRPYIKKKK
jgi:hypothetical protein